MNAGAYTLKPFSLFSSWRSFLKARAPSTAASASGTAPSSGTATPKSPSSVRKLRPSFFFQGFFLCFLIAGWLAATGEAERADPRAAPLLARGWTYQSEAPCEGLRPGAYYETVAGEDSAELLYVAPGKILANAESWPEGPRACREISEPSNIEELQ